MKIKINLKNSQISILIPFTQLPCVACVACGIRGPNIYILNNFLVFNKVLTVVMLYLRSLDYYETL